ncbi:hypothetical protein [Psychroserpens mesophilus]|uniref:hypothetical protein n=1 Tax=Psychroserpens mesophilus TaxID=325473 RepID=UPI003D657438
MKNVLLVACLLIALTSCKENKSEKTDNKAEIQQKENARSIKEELVVELHVEYLKNDNIWLFYTEDYQEYSFPVENAIQKSVKGKEGFQLVSFEFPKEVYPERIKIRFSNNKDQNTIKLKEIKISKAKNVLTIDPSNFVNYFNFSKFISTSDGYELYLKEVDNLYDPNIVSSSQLDNELIKL